MSWFEVKITYEKEIAVTGRYKKVTESYLIDAETFTDAEARMTDIMSSRGPFIIDVVKKVRYAELFIDNKSQRYYKAKVGFISLDEKAGIEKKKYVQMLIQADDLLEALESLKRGMSTSLEDYDIAVIKETLIVEVIESSVNYGNKEKN